MELSPEQKEAVDLCLNPANRIVAITGQAGTGKTTIIKTLAEYYNEKGTPFVLCAPTGKAARRITEATGFKAVTMHRLLEYPKPGERNPETGEVLDTTHPKRGYKIPLDQKVVIADEYAMVNHSLSRNLMDALGSGARLICFGDINQLAPIEKDKIKSEDSTPFEKLLDRVSYRLDRVFRQSGDSGILFNADRIRRGLMPVSKDDFKVNFILNPVKVLSQYVLDNLENDLDFRSVKNQIIVADRKSWIGTRKLNRMLRDALNEYPVDEFDLPRYSWDELNPVRIGVGDKIINTENRYDMRHYDDRYGYFRDDGTPAVESYIDVPPSKEFLNGEIGIVTEIFADGSFHVDVGDRLVEVPAYYNEYNHKNGSVFPIDPRKGIDLAYAVTTHKVQGSEFDNVVYVMNRSVSYMYDRKNFYTAVTRAKSHVQVMTDQNSLQAAMRLERPAPKKKVLGK